jgi:hypothetical protein
VITLEKIMDSLKGFYLRNQCLQVRHGYAELLGSVARFSKQILNFHGSAIDEIKHGRSQVRSHVI